MSLPIHYGHCHFYRSGSTTLRMSHQCVYLNACAMSLGSESLSTDNFRGLYQSVFLSVYVQDAECLLQTLAP